MSVVPSDIVIYGAENIAEASGQTQGGAIDETVRYVFDDSALANTLNDTLELLSDNAADTGIVTIYGRNSEGSIVNEAIAMSGTTVVNGSQNFERILKIVADTGFVHSGTITVRDASSDVSVAQLESGVYQVRRPFYDVSADVAGGSSRDFYEKLFIKNNSTGNALLNATVAESGDTLGKVTFDLEDAKDDNNSTADRQDTAPGGMLGSFDNTTKNVPGTDLGSGEAIGFWMRLTLAAGDAANKGVWTVQVDGSTT